jgi:hypothetical protein
MKIVRFGQDNNKAKASKMRAITVAVVSGILLLGSWENVANARVSGYGAQHVVPRHLAPRFNRAFRWPLYGGFLAVPAYPADGYFGNSPYAPFAPDSSAATDPGEGVGAQRCQNPTHRTVTVPSDGGGTKQVTVTYCHP